jgi:outer membrane lipase/esterase
MRVSFRRVAARSFWIASGLVFCATMGPPSAWAQQTCELPDVLRGVVGSVATGTGSIVENTAAVAATNNSVVQPLTGIVGPVVGAVPSVINNVPPATDALLTSSLDPVGGVVNQTAVGPVINQVEGVVCNTVQALGVQSTIAALVTINLTDVIFGRLDASQIRGGGPWPTDGRLGAADKSRPAPPPGSVGPLAVYASGTLLGGNASDLPGAAGFSYDGGSALIGLEYSVNRNLILGIAGSFTTINADVNTGANVDADVFHGAAYLSYSTRAWFVDALAAYGVVDLDLARPGTNEIVRGSTSGGAWAAATRAGYLLDFGKVRAGPIAGLTYVHASVDGYTEAGSDPSRLVVGDQTVDSLTSSVGVRFLAPFQAGGSIFIPYLNVTLEHQFGDDRVELTTGLATPGSPAAGLSFPTFGDRDYGKVEGGLTIELTPQASVNVSGASTFARDDGQDYRISAGLNHRF